MRDASSVGGIGRPRRALGDPLRLTAAARLAVISDVGAAASAATGFGIGLGLDLAPVPSPWAQLAFGVGIVVGGWRPALDGVRELRRRRLDVDLLMVVAAVAAAGLGQWRDASLLILIFATSMALETAAIARTAAGVRALLVDAPEHADQLLGESIETVPAADLVVGDRVLVRHGARVPADGTVAEGEAAVDESSLTGEPLPVRRTVGEPVLAGSTIVEGTLVVDVTVNPDDSVLARLSAAVREAIEQRPPTQLFVERFEQRYSVGVVLAAVLIAVAGPTWWSWTGTEAVTRTMTFLVVASPCAVVLATMPATLSALAAAARHRVLIRGGGALERLADLDVAAFDKTGTLTVGAPEVVEVTALGVMSPDEVLAVAASVERWSEHPIGRSVVTAAARRRLVLSAASDVEVVAGRGVRGRVERVVAGRTVPHRVRVGGPALLDGLPHRDDGTAVVGVELDGTLVGTLALRDRIRDEARCTISCLRRAGVTDTVMLTGDHAGPAEVVAATAGIASIHHGMRPDEKSAHVRHLRDTRRTVAYVGDGVNDAAALATATVGISLGQRGAALAVDAADVVIIDDNLHRLPDVVHLATRARRTVQANLAFALAAIAVLVSFDLAGRLPLVVGVVGHEGSSVLVALNGLRLLRWRPPVHRSPDRVELDGPLGPAAHHAVAAG